MSGGEEKALAAIGASRNTPCGTTRAARPHDGRYYQAEIETLPRHELERLQLERLREVFARAHASVAFYRAKFAEAGVDASAFGSVHDLARMPFTTKDDLRAAYPFAMLAVPAGELRRVHASSGTTGQPTLAAYTARDLDTWAELMARSMFAAGVRPGDLFHNAHGYGLFTGGLGLHDGATRLGCAVVPVSGGNTERQVLLLRDLGADAMCATPSYALHVAEVAKAMGVDLRGAPLRVGLFGGEPWSEGLRRRLEDRLGIKANDLYGLCEVMGPGVACECADGGPGLHGWEDHFVFELADPDSGEPVDEDGPGELVITTLTKEAMPLIRYRTGDITRLASEPCACGRTHLRLMRVSGRADDMLIIRGVNLFPSQVEALLVGQPDIAPHYQLVVRRDGALDSLTIEVESERDLDDAEAVAVAARVLHRIKSMTGIACEVAVRPPGSLPRSQGKAVRVRDLR